MDIILVFVVMMILIAGFSSGGRQSTKDSVQAGISDSVGVVKDSWKLVVVVIGIVAALFYFGYLAR